MNSPLYSPEREEEDSDLSEFTDCQENQRTLQDEYQELQERLKRGLKAFGLKDVEKLTEEIAAEIPRVQKKENEGVYLQGLEELLAVSKEAERIRLEISSQKEYNLINKEYESGLKKLELKTIDEVKGDLEFAIKNEQRLREANRPVGQKEQEKMQELKHLVALWEQGEKLRLEEEKRQEENKKQQRLVLFREGMEKFSLKTLQDIEGDLKAAHEEVERVASRPNQLKEAKKKVEELEALLQVGKEVEEILVEEELKQYQEKIQEKDITFQKGLEGLDLTSIDQLKGDLEFAFKNEQRLREANRPVGQKEQEKIKELKHLVALWEEAEKLKTELEEKQRQAKKGKQADPAKYLEDPALSSDVIELSAREEIPLPDEPNEEEKAETRPETNLEEKAEKRPENNLEEMKQENDAQTLFNKERQKVKEELENMKIDISHMPFCFERLLISMNILVSKVFYSEYTESESSDSVREEIPKVLNQLKERAKVEILDTNKMKNDLDEISILIHQGNWESAKDSLRLRLRERQPLNIAEVERLIQKGSEATTLIRGNHAIIFIAETGAGKSTTLHYLSGSQFKEGKGCYIPINIKNSALADVTTSASSASETRYIKCIKMKLTELGIPKSGDVYFLDLPGFEDTNGPEVDISNAVNIFRTLSECKSVKPVVLISLDSLGMRMKGVKKLARILSGMLPGMKQSMEKSPFTYLFTKFPPEKIELIQSDILEMLDKLTPEERADKGFCNIIEDMISKIQGEPEGKPPTIDLLKTQEAKRTLLRIIDSNFISQPDTEFKFSIAEDAKGKLQKQCFLTQETIRSATERMDFELVIYKLSELKKLSELVSLELVEKSYLDSVQHVAKFLDTYSQTSLEKFNRCFKDGHTLEKKDIDEFLHSMKNAQAADQLRKEHLPKEVTSSSAFMQTVVNQSNQLLTKIKESLITDRSLKSHIEKLELLSTLFVNVKQEYAASIVSLIAKSKEAAESLKSLHEKDEFEKSVRLLQNIYGFMECMEVYLSEDIVKESKKMITDFLSGDIQGTGAGLESVFQKNRINPEDEERLQKGFARLRNIKEKYNNQLDIITSVYQEITQRSLRYIKETNVRITRVYEGERYEALFDVERLFKEIVLLRKIPEIAAETHQVYYETVNSLRAISHQVKIDILEEMKKCQNSQTNEEFDYRNLLRYLLVLESMRWMEDFNQEDFIKIKRTIDEEVMEHSEIHKKQLMKFNLDVDNYDQLEQAKLVASKLNQILVLERFLPIVSVNQKIVTENFENKIKTTLDVIRGHLDKWTESKMSKKLEREEIEKSLLYLKKCKELSLFQVETAELLSNLKTLTGGSYLGDSEKLESCHQAMISYDITQNNEKLGTSVRTSVLFAQPPEEKNSNSDGSDNISSVSERLEMSQMMSKESLEKNAQIMLKILRRVTQLKRDVPNLYQIYDTEDSLIDYWREELKFDFKELSGKMLTLSDSANSSVNKYQEFKSKLHIAQALSVLDEFLDGESFRKLYEEYQTKHSKQEAQTIEKFLKSLKSGEFGPILNNIRHLRNRKNEGEACSDKYEELKHCLSDALKDLMNKIVSQTNLVFFEKGLPNMEKIGSIVSKMARLGRAQECCESEDLNFSVEKFKVCIDKVERIISDELNTILKEYRNLMRLRKYGDAELQRQRFIQICKMLGLKWEENLSQSNAEFDQIREEEVEKIIKPYEEMPIEKYAYKSPREVYSSLELRREDHFYEIVLRSFEKTIEEKCWNEVRRIETLDLTKKAENLKEFRSILSCLPACIETSLSKKIGELEGNVDQIKKRYGSELQSVKRNNDVRRTADLRKNFKEMKMEQDLEDLEEHISKETQQLKSNMLSSLYSKDVEKGMKQLAELNERNSTLGDVQGINQVYLEGRTTSMQIVQNWYASSLKGFDPTVHENINGAEIEQSFVCLMKFVKFKKTSQNNIFEDLLPKAQIEHINDLIVDFIKNYKKSCSDAFDSYDFLRINKFLKFAQVCGPLVGHLKTYAIENADDYPCLSSVKAMMAEVEHYKGLHEKFRHMILELSEKLAKIEFLNERTKKFIKSITEFFVELNNDQCNLEKAQKFENLELDAKLLFNQSCDRINAQRDQIYQRLEVLVERVFEDDVQKEEYDKFNMLYNNLVAATKNLKSLKSNGFGPEEIEQRFKRKLGLSAQEAQNEPESAKFLETLAEGLQKLKGLALNVSVFKPEIEGKINEVLTSFKTMKGSRNIPKLAKLLSLDRKGYGPSLVSDCQMFKNEANSIFINKTQKYDIKYVLQHLRGSGINTAFLRRRYDEFHKKYQELVDTYLKPNIDLSDLVSNTKLLAGSVSQTLEETKWSSDMVAKIPELLAHIFAIWTLQNAGSYFETDDSMNRASYLLQPHAAQVISIFRLLGVGEEGSRLQNNLAQIGTGEGKSITLAVTGIVFALFGFNVFSGCYNSYLCERDYRAFSSLFSLLGVSEKIRYGTFNKICEDLINQDGDIRKLVEKLFVEGTADTSAAAMVKNKSNCLSILLIDEVDVFFSKEFYGRLYTPSASIRDPTIIKLTDLIWQNRKSNLVFSQVKEMQEYKDCCARFHNLEGLIEEAVKDMLFDLKEFESHDYIVKADKIGYKQCENISFKVICRYQTLFAYYLEHERQNISAQSLEENKRLIIKCGSFSYAEIIKQFKYIMGVTGTLEQLSNMEKHVIEEEYQIKKQSFLPSVFGDNLLNYSEKNDITISNERDYYNTLKREITNGLNSGKSSTAKRAVLGFFESDKKLMEFLNSSQMADMKDEVEYLTEEATAEEKENIVKRATSAGRVTLLTRSFGRGTDFVVHDQEVAANGGIHVIQAFLSEERSEEVQIRGRTARQGDLGSYSMVLQDLSLEKFSILPEDFEKLKIEGKVWNRLKRLVTLDSVEYKNAYELMNARRNELFAQTYKNNEKCVIEAKEMHTEAMKFLGDISSRNMDAIRLFLVSENKGVSEAKKCRTIIATDGTYSMNPLHQNTKTTIKNTCSNVTATLKTHGLPEDCFQLQFAVYRNYNSEEDKLLQFSTWETKPNDLTPFLESIAVEGGWGNEAIEVAFSYANQQHEKEPISQIILIGDAPANSEKEVEAKRIKSHGESYWSTTKFATKTNYKEEVVKLKENGIPVHSFYMKESAKENFTEISNATGGKCAPLDIDSDAGATALTNLVTEVLLKQIGEQNGKGDELVQAFRNKVVQSYSE